MAGVCVDKLPHDECGSPQGLQVFQQEDGSVNGYCYRCGKFVADPYGGKEPPKIDLEEKKRRSKEYMNMIEGLGCHSLPKRKLGQASLEQFGMKVGLSEQDGKTPMFLYQPYRKDGEIVAWKVRNLLTKDMWSVGSMADCDLFGWDEALATGSKRLIITEGELDAGAGYAIVNRLQKEQFKEYAPAFVSLAKGASSARRDLTRLKEKIKRNFKEVSFCFDDDEAGKKALSEAMQVFPNATSIELPCKDLNDCLLQGKPKAAFKALMFNHEKPKNSRLVRGGELHEAAKEPPKKGLSWPWEEMTQRTRGARFGEVHYFGAGQKQGKSELVNTFAAHFMKEHDLKVFLCKPEEANNKTYKMVAGKLEGQVFHDPNRNFDNAAYERRWGGHEGQALHA